MKNNLISIIVPMYNSEKHLETLFKSISNQKYNNYELLLIDDGSKDNTKKICKEYAKKNDKAKYYYKDNSGVSDTRNIGIKKANGDYICFVDSDDIISENYLSDFAESINENSNSIVCCKCEIFSDEKSIKNHNISSNNKSKHFLNNKKYEVIYTEYAGYSVNKLFKRDILIKNKLFFNSEIGMCEDLLFVFEYLKYVDRVECLENINYYYRKSEQSASKNLSNEKWFSIFKTYELIEKNINICSENFKRKFDFMYQYYILYGKFRLRFIKDSKNYNKIKNDITQRYKNIDILNKKFNTKQKIKLLVYKYFNYIAFKVKEK